MSKFDEWLTKHLGPKLMSVVGVISAVLGFGLAFLLFFWLPSFVFDTVDKIVSIDMLKFKVIFEGAIRITLFVLYMALIAMMKDIKRLYMYHGAEHKAIFCYESGEKLTVDNVRKQKRFHPRCGTSFIFVMIILSILISSVVAVSFPILTQPANRAWWMLVKLMIVPIIMSIGYEFIRYAGCHQNIIIKILSAPGLWMQRITTKEPTDDIIEVGIAALKAVLPEQEPANIPDSINEGDKPHADDHLTEFANENEIPGTDDL